MAKLKKKVTVLKPCIRCDDVSTQTWDIPAHGTIRLCTVCDAMLNRMALNYLGFTDRDDMMDAYAEKMNA